MVGVNNASSPEKLRRPLMVDVQNPSSPEKLRRPFLAPISQQSVLQLVIQAQSNYIMYVDL